MEFEGKYESGLRMNWLIVERSNFERAISIGSGQLRFDINKEVDFVSECRAQIRLICTISSQDNSMSLSVCLLAEFELIGNEYTWEQMQPNAIAIMYPFLRSQISLLTTQPDLLPIMLPAINVNELLKDIESQ